MELNSLRQHQHETVIALRADWKKYRSHLINLPCGAGKTAIASYLCGSFAKAGMKTVFAAPYVALVNQTYERFSQYGLGDLSVIWQNDERYNPKSLIHIASADTLGARGRKAKASGDMFGGGEPQIIPEGTDVFIWDECDLRRVALLDELSRRPEIKVIGLTATPYAKWLGEHYENFIKPTTANDLIEMGWLTGFDIRIPNVNQSLHVMDGVKSRRDPQTGELDYATGEAAAAMMQTKVVGSILGNWLEHGNNLPTIGFAQNKASANAYAREFIAAGVPCAVIVDQTPVDERDEIYRDFAAGIIKVIWNVGVLGAGFDSDVRCIIWAQARKSERAWVQGTMRGSRPAEGKESCLLFDHTPTWFNLGDPNDIEYYELLNGDDGLEQTRARRREKEKAEAREKLCKKCGRMKKPKEYKCLKCKHKPLGGDAVECDESIELVSVSKKKEKHTFWSELKGWQTQQRNSGKNIIDGRLANLYRNKFGVWPRGMSDKPDVPTPETLNFIKHDQIRYAKSKQKALAK